MPLYEVFSLVYLFIGVGGIAGSLLRYFISSMSFHIWSPAFPVATLMINLTGSFLLGWCSSYLQASKKVAPYIKSAITTGLIGSYTTFSTFCLETIQLIESGDYLKGLLYLFISLLGGLIFVKLGIKLGFQWGKEAGETV